MRNFLFIALTTFTLLLACKSKEVPVSNSTCDSCENAIIRFYGEPALDGCGWVVEVASTIYMPKNLNSEFFVDNLQVKIKFKEQGRANCGLIKDKYPAMFIEKIYKK